MDLRPRCEGKIRQLMEKGIRIPNPLTLDIGDEVRPEQISGDGVTLFPGCRIYGEKTLISRGARIGYEGPATIEDCQIGPMVELKGGFFRESTFLERSAMSLGAQVREGCILEEQASGAHCVGLKQTILFPYVTLGSLINFCDCMMSGGTGRRDHSEVGSSYIHFNFTPDGDKATPSLIGDVPRGVMLRERPIFLGGQGGMVGPLRIGYGNVVAAGAILRGDLLEEDRLVLGKSYQGMTTRFTPRLYQGLSRILGNNLIYLANLAALESWYTHVRRSFFARQEFGDLMYRGALEKISMAKKERSERLIQLARKTEESLYSHRPESLQAVRKKEFRERVRELRDLFAVEDEASSVREARERFLIPFQEHMGKAGGTYLEIIHGLSDSTAKLGTSWLQHLVSSLCSKAAVMLPSFSLFREQTD